MPHVQEEVNGQSVPIGEVNVLRQLRLIEALQEGLPQVSGHNPAVQVARVGVNVPGALKQSVAVKKQVQVVDANVEDAKGAEGAENRRKLGALQVVN